MKINASTCIIIHIGRDGTDTYMVSNNELPVAIVSQDMKTAARHCVIASKDLKTGRSIRRAFRHVDAKIFLTFYTVFVRHKLEHYIQAARLHLKRSIEPLKQVQRNTNKLILGIERLLYDARLVNISLFLLLYRRNIGDLTTVLELLTDKFASDVSSRFLFYEMENL